MFLLQARFSEIRYTLSTSCFFGNVCCLVEFTTNRPREMFHFAYMYNFGTYVSISDEFADSIQKSHLCETSRENNSRFFLVQFQCLNYKRVISRFLGSCQNRVDIFLPSYCGYIKIFRHTYVALIRYIFHRLLTNCSGWSTKRAQGTLRPPKSWSSYLAWVKPGNTLIAKLLLLSMASVFERPYHWNFNPRNIGRRFRQRDLRREIESMFQATRRLR